MKKADEVDLQALQESEKALQENIKAKESLKPPRLIEYQPMLGARVNKYSLISIRKDTKEQKVLLQNRGEIKKDRQRPEDNAKTDASLFKLPKQSGFADKGG